MKASRFRIENVENYFLSLELTLETMRRLSSSFGEGSWYPNKNSKKSKSLKKLQIYQKIAIFWDIKKLKTIQWLVKNLP